MASDAAAILDRLEKLASEAPDYRTSAYALEELAAEAVKALPALVKALRKALETRHARCDREPCICGWRDEVLAELEGL